MNKLVTILVICVVALSASTAYLALSLRSHQEEFAKLSLQRVSSGPLIPARPTSVEPSPKDDKTLSGKPVEASAVPEGTEEATSLRQQLPLRDPRFRAAQLESLKQNLWLQNAEAIKAVRLSHEMADSLMELLAEHQLQWTEQPVGIPPGTDRLHPDINLNNPPEWFVKLQREKERRQAEIAALLGDAKYREWNAFYETASARQEVAQLERALEGSENPLHADQQTALIEAIADEWRKEASDPRSESDATASEDEIEILAELNERLHQAAARSLSASQLEVYQATLDRKLAQAKAQLAVQRVYLESQSDAQPGSVVETAKPQD